MSLKSSLSTFYFLIVIALLVQQRFFVCAFECFCDCNKRYVCDELNRLATSDDTNKGQWRKWNTHFMYLDTLHRDFDPKVWTEKISSVENKTDSIESLKGKLKDTESHVTRLETALENVRKEFEEKMADFAQKMRDVQSHAITLVRNVNEAEKVITASQITISGIEERMRFVENQTQRLEPAIEDEKRAREQMRVTISGIEERIRFVENQTKRLEPAIEDEKRAREQMRAELLLNSSKTFSDVNKRYEKLKDLETKLLNVDTETKLLKSEIEEERIARKNSEIKISNIETKVGFVENETKKFEQAIEASERSREQLRVNVSTIEERTHVVENQIKRFLPVIEAEKKTKEQLEVNISSIEARMNFVENQTKILDLVTEEEKREREQLERRLFQNVSSENSEAESQFEELKNYLDSELLRMKNETIDLKSDIENEKELRIEFQEIIYQRIPKKFESVENQYKVLKEDFQEELLTVKEEINTLKSDIDRERKVWTSFQEEMLLNTSKKFSEWVKQYTNLKNDFDAKLLNVIKDIKRLKSDLEEEKSARKNSSEENKETHFSVMSTLEMKDMEFQITISEVEQRLLNVENEVENFMSAIKAERQAREELEVKLRTNFSASTPIKEYLDIRENLTSVEQNVSNLYQIISLKDISFDRLQRTVKYILNKIPVLESALAKEKSAREELERKVRERHPLGSYRSRTSRALERSLNEIQKDPNTSENKATPMETVISMDQSVSNIYR